jgi:hypothetical protein
VRKSGEKAGHQLCEQVEKRWDALLVKAGVLLKEERLVLRRTLLLLCRIWGLRVF